MYNRFVCYYNHVLYYTTRAVVVYNSTNGKSDSSDELFPITNQNAENVIDRLYRTVSDELDGLSLLDVCVVLSIAELSLAQPLNFLTKSHQSIKM